MLETIINQLSDAAFVALFQQWLLGITSVVTAASAITALTPTKKDDKIRSVLLSVLNFLALNIGNAGKKDYD